MVVSAADCRLMVFQHIDDMTKMWIKAKHFSIEGLLMNKELAQGFHGGSAVIFRLAPQE